MNTTAKTGLIVAILIVLVLVLVLVFGGGTMAGGTFGGGMMGSGTMGGISWMWILVVLLLGFGAWVLFSKKQ